LDALERVFREGYNYRKAGIMLNNLSLADQLTLRMFGDEKAERFRQVMVAVEQAQRSSRLGGAWGAYTRVDQLRRRTQPGGGF
jgi:hypothetical protein